MKRILNLIITLILTINLFAKEGMWVPIFLEGVIMNDMNFRGLRLSAEDIYSVNTSSLKDAVVRFGGGCTGEIISSDGLLLTNHHCGYGNIQSHSSIEHDYLTDGFWAMTRKEELKNPGLTATFIVRIEDVTDDIMAGVPLEDSPEKRDDMIQSNIKAIVGEKTKDSHYEAFIKPFFEGNQYILFVTETFKDVRLVGAPPSSIGKYGFDTDNWVWPRHTGDFSIFRIYADKDNKPAEYNEDNIPYHPQHHLPISLKGYNEGDFTMVYGFPYKTEEYLSSFAVDHQMNVSIPAKIKVRTMKLEVLDKLMREDDVVRIKYAAKQSSTSNAWKKWRGQLLGLKKVNAVSLKKKQENELKYKMGLYPEKFKAYNGLLEKMEETYRELNEISLARDYFLEIGYFGTDVLRIGYFLEPYFKKIDEGKELTDKDKEKLNATLSSMFKDFDPGTDRQVFEAIFPVYLNSENNFYKPDVIKEVESKYKGDVKAWTDKLFEKSILTDERKLTAMMLIEPEKGLKKISKDPLFMLASDLMAFYRGQIEPAYKTLNEQLDRLNKSYFDAMRLVYPDKLYYPDANGTLRLSYGKIQGMKPADAVEYRHFTTFDGVMEKYEPGSYEFDLPERLVQLYKEKAYDEYGQGDELRVCFIASNHTSGGNSGSPVLNGNGELIGLNFDRNWEGTMSDIVYDVDMCRNISVDIRYVMFIIDKFAGAQRLIDEMTIVR